MSAEPWSLKFLREQWCEKLADHVRMGTDQTLMRAITAERHHGRAPLRVRVAEMATPADGIATARRQASGSGGRLAD